MLWSHWSCISIHIKFRQWKACNEKINSRHLIYFHAGSSSLFKLLNYLHKKLPQLKLDSFGQPSISSIAIRIAGGKEDKGSILQEAFSSLPTINILDMTVFSTAAIICEICSNSYTVPRPSLFTLNNRMGQPKDATPNKMKVK